jgi:hypothetical protein
VIVFLLQSMSSLQDYDEGNEATKPAGYLGFKNHPMCLISMHFWGSPILHDELGLVKDWITGLENLQITEWR